jgi:hypothetical protein
MEDKMGNKIKLVDLLNAQPVVQSMMDRKMPSKLAYGLAKNFRMIGQELESYNQARVNLLQANWTLDPETNKYNIPDDDQPKWRIMHDELIQAESDYQPYKVDFNLTEDIEMTPGELLSLWFIFDGDGQGPAAAAP